MKNLNLKVLFLLLIALPEFGLSNKVDSCHFRSNLSVLVLGNSITIHSPSEKIGWKGNWGLAASTEEADYVHLLKAEILLKYTDVDFRYFNIANTFEKKYRDLDLNDYKNIKDFKPDLLIIRLGDNVGMDGFNSNILMCSLKKLVNYLGGDARVFITSRFWPKKPIDDTIKECASKNNWVYIDISGLGLVSENMAGKTFKDSGVAMHPSDLGMLRIKERIWLAIKRYI